MKLTRLAHILLFVLTVFVTVPAICDTAFADILSVESVSGNDMDPQTLEADDFASVPHLYMRAPEPIAVSTVEGSGGQAFAVPPLWWRPPMRNAA